jgi:hypothetical protein
MHGFNSSQSRSEQVGGNRSGRVVEHIDADVKRERERRGLGCLILMKLGEGICTIQVWESNNICYAGKRWEVGKRWTKKSKQECPAGDIMQHHTWKVVGVQIEDRKWIVVAMWQQAQRWKEQQCSGSDSKGNDGEAKKGAMVLNREIR